MKNFLLIFIAITVLFACKKDEPDIIEPVVYPVYGNLQIGNYWTYQHFNIDTNGVVTPLDKFDTCYIEKDTIVGGYTYFKMIRPSRVPRRIHTYYWREKEGVIYDTTGEVFFSAEDFSTIFDTEYITNNNNTDTLYKVTRKMVDKDLMITTPAGYFFTRTFQTKYQPDDFLDNRTRYSNTRYCKDIGIVSETLEIYSTMPDYTERRLVSWHLHSFNKN